MINQERESICKNCGDAYAFVLYDLSMGRIEGQHTNFELLKCMSCGQIRTEKFETIR
jgi:uncharacterized Zn finger protein